LHIRENIIGTNNAENNKIVNHGVLLLFPVFYMVHIMT